MAQDIKQSAYDCQTTSSFSVICPDCVGTSARVGIEEALRPIILRGIDRAALRLAFTRVWMRSMAVGAASGSLTLPKKARFCEVPHPN